MSANATKPQAAAPAPKATAPKPAAVTVRPQAAAPANPVQALRDRIAELLAQRDRVREQVELLEAAPRPLAEALADVDELIQSAAARVEVPVAWVAQRPGQAVAVASALCDGRPDRAPVPGGFAVQCWADPAGVRDRLEHDLRESYRRLPAPVASEADRERRLAELRGKISGIERQVAELWWQATDAGMPLEPPDVHGGVLIGLEAT